MRGGRGRRLIAHQVCGGGRGAYRLLAAWHAAAVGADIGGGVELLQAAASGEGGLQYGAFVVDDVEQRFVGFCHRICPIAGGGVGHGDGELEIDGDAGLVGTKAARLTPRLGRGGER